MTSLAEQKSALRKEFKQRRKKLPAEIRQALSQQAIAALAQRLPAEIRSLGLFSPIKSEISPLGLCSLRPGLGTAFPRIRSATEIDFAWAKPEELIETGKWRIPEPPPELPPAAPQQIDALIVPGLAFSSAGGRLGYGAGHYDRWLSQPGAEGILLIGFCFEIQLVEELTLETHDRPMHFLCTEKGFRPANP